MSGSDNIVPIRPGLEWRGDPAWQRKCEVASRRARYNRADPFRNFQDERRPFLGEIIDEGDGPWAA